ncbi:D-lactate dehydrogenase [Providencia huaxiensis]|uniref:Quinone-dependent D-lactate dehydrogenase n=3 Tax=Morganellaceae TaxID=1903414 RepID=A0A3R8Y593_PRORE|nr:MULTISPECIES: D-lactate dehydrogenase [Providencia]ELR5074029.1 D-lactate dehydrogenase [Providencia stuartii]ELR5216889.1 D-lactate dehydrogenase [Providencia rettgeri]MBQ0267097.1 D-lactate dehydrogenase [Providencia huaxiensis]MBV2190593.1 D-lactate dehydrogenase [Providencia rettgeri]HEC8322373.1 D-lactate dehydrogenase [Providencia rettgeri]
MNDAKKPENQRLLLTLRNIVGKKNILTEPHKTERYRKGFRSGMGDAIAVVFPTTLLEQWYVFKACVEADKIVLMQAANTGLTEGSTPSGYDYDRDIVIISTLKLNQIQVLPEFNQVVAMPGSTLYDLEKILKPLGREPHSLIGSSCIGASVVGGICNSSGGSLVRRGPAYTELALYGRVNDDGKVELVNHLGIDLGNTPEEILTNLQNRGYSSEDVQVSDKLASDHEYAERVRDVDADTPSRFNADERRLFEASGCAGKLAVFAVRLDTFPADKKTQVFYIGSNNPDVLEDIRRYILSEFKNLPVAGEYMHRGCFDIAEVYGKDTFLMIDKFGTDKMPMFFTIKGRIDAVLNKVPFLPSNLIDRTMQVLSKLWPSHLPPRMKEFRDRYEHHLMLKMAGDGIDEAKVWLKSYFSNADGGYFECTPEEGAKAFLHRFAAAGSAVRYHAVHNKDVEDVLPLDIALRRNDRNWFETLPPEIEKLLVHKLYCGHFMCHVMHQDYVLKKGVDPKELKEKMLALLDERGAQYPAEHNVGHLYKAPEQLKSFYKQSDPTNTMNPGLGKTTKRKNWEGDCGCGHTHDQ